MKKKALAALSLATVLIFASACGQSNDSSSSTSEETEAAETATATEIDSSESLGTTSDGELSTEEETDILNTEYRDFAKALQEQIEDKSLEDISTLLAYPCYISYADGTDVTVENEEEFLDLEADQVFSDDLVEAVQSADVDSIEPTDKGLVVGAESGTPNVTFGLGGDDTVGIIGINN